ncbi:alpha-galactosidase, partial [Tessaracoccus sp. ZS01]
MVSSPSAAAPVPDPTLAVAAEDHPLGNLAPTPPMGWSSWNTFGCDISADLIEQTADALVESGMAAAGYEYVNIDDCWSTMSRSADGKLVPDPAKFPQGIKGVADYVHGLGLKLGIYSSAGTTTCAGYPASLGYEMSDAQQWADWGVDLVKYDNCGGHGGLEEQERYQAMADAIAATGRDMLFSLCDWGEGRDWLWNGTDQVGHFYRTTYDIRAEWSVMMSNGDFQAEMAPYAGPNSWADPDMLVVGVNRFLGNDVPGLTPGESRVHMGLWAITNAPLIAGNDVRSMEPWVRELLTNPRVIEIDQDWSGEIGTRLRHNGDEDVWVKQMEDGSTAVLLINRGTEARTISVDPAEVGRPDGASQQVTDVWSGRAYAASDAVRARVAGHDAALFVIGAPTQQDLEAMTTLETDVPPYLNLDTPFELTVRLHNDGTESVRNVRLEAVVPDGWLATSATSSVAAQIEPGQSATLTVDVEPDSPAAGAAVFESSATWDGKSGVMRTTDRATALALVPPAAGTTQVSAVEWLSSTNGWGPVERDTSVGNQALGDGLPLTIGGKIYETGLGAHAPSEVRVYLGGVCESFDAEVGLDDEVGNYGRVDFVVLADGVEVARVAAAGADAAKPVSVSMVGVDVMTLAVDAVDGENYDHADWADARVRCTEPPTPTPTPTPSPT